MPGLLDPVDLLSEIERRAPCSDAERRAANELREELEDRGHEAWVEPVWTRPQWPSALMLHTLLAVAASIVSVSVPAVGLGLGLFAAIGLALEAGGLLSPVRLLFRRRATQMVVTEPDDPDVIALVLCAAYDAPRRGLVFRDRVRRLVPWFAPLGFLVTSSLIIAAAAGARLAGLEGDWIGAVQFVPTVGLLLAFAAAADIGLSDVSPGASDPASGVAVALAVHDELVDDPPEELASTVLLHGAGENIPPAALRSYLRREKLDPRQTVVLELGACGGGEPIVSARHRQLRAAAAAAGLPLAPRRTTTGLRAARSLRLPAARIDCRVGGIVPRSRQPSDTADAVDERAVEAAVDAVLDLVDALDAALVERLSGGQAERVAASSTK